MEIYSTEEQQVEAIKKFWKDYGTSILAGAVIGLGALYGWNYYSSYQIKKAEAASEAFNTALSTSKDAASTLAAAAQFDKAHSQPGYSALMQLIVAKTAAESGDLDKASSALQEVLAAKPTPVVAAIASLRLARVQAEQGQLDAALTTLNNVSDDAFAAEKSELEGDFYVRKGDAAKARSAYQAAIEKGGAASSPALQMKLDNLNQA
ncbi:tetratricopeptide repeat protein [Shewanella yunxiaonensis]|uniref:Ancillary SecYEG translocon subunit n=1 Tax=Shewanella yunxiaonensis TaxID=2829809 RepID=A0ABX7YRE5_9GAMM|nr:MULTISPECIES: tetratricopeptide repeat protein [Shewanella]MDF0534837.1 tetratricopeptide repeat protein [Shewanella sp. A32]QUN04746.1 tetratricopeptide repeat protein [Shewanella yunxiaonensis]